MSITSQVVLLFIVVIVGALCRHLRFLTDQSISDVTKLVVNVTLPCVTIYNMQRAFEPSVFVNFLITLVLTFIFIAAAMLLSHFVFFRSKPERRRPVLSNMQAFSNCGFMGYPIILAINPDLMIYAVGYNIAYTILLWTLGAALFSGKESVNLKKALLHPTIIAAVIGLVVFCGNIRLPLFVQESLSLIGGLTTPLSMLLVGTRVYGIKFDFMRDMDVHITVLLRLIVQPLLLLGICTLLPIAHEVTQVIFILTAMPIGTMVAMLAELSGGDSTFAARCIAYSTLLSLFTVPVMCMLL